ncbi:MAG: chemotaxis protein CheX [bacterium]
MDKNLVKPFVTCVRTTLQQYDPDISINAASQEEIESTFEAHGTLTMLGINGDVEGSVEFVMSRETGTNLAGTLMHKSCNEFDEDCKEAIQEFTNMAVGNAVTDLKSMLDDRKIDITPPTMFVGNNIQISSNVESRPVHIPLSTSLGDIELSVALDIH